LESEFKIAEVTQMDGEMASLLLGAGLVPPEGSARRRWWAAQSGRHGLVGMIGLESAGKHFLLRSLAVRSEVRGRGIGNRLISTALSAAGAPGQQIYAATTTTSPLLEQWGFARVGRDAAPSAIASTDQRNAVCPEDAVFLVLTPGPLPFRVREVRPEDAKDIARIYNQGIASRRATFETLERTEHDRLQWITDSRGRYPIVVAEREDSVMGFASVSAYSSRECYRGIGEFSIYVEEGRHGHGVGRRLLNALIRRAAQQGFWKLLSRVFLFNEASRSLCKSCGFREVGIYEQHAQLDGQWLDVVIVERLLP
jgi:L-amino acid N-acyltransferase YncA